MQSEFSAPEQAPPQLDLADVLGRSGRRGFDRELTLQGLRNGGYFDMPIQVLQHLLGPDPSLVHALAAAYVRKEVCKDLHHK